MNVQALMNDPRAAAAMLRMALWNVQAADVPEILGHVEAVRVRLMGQLMQPQSADPGTADRLLSMQEVAERLGVKESYGYELARQGKLRSVKMGKYVRVPESALVAYQADLLKKTA